MTEMFDGTADWHAANLPQAQPLDEVNRQWLEHTHPSDWTNPTPAGRYNIVVTGGGSTLAATIHPYPTEAEIFKKAGDAYSRTRLTPRVKGLFETLLSWRR